MKLHIVLFNITFQTMFDIFNLLFDYWMILFFKWKAKSAVTFTKNLFNMFDSILFDNSMHLCY